jgi:hypothetical protein
MSTNSGPRPGAGGGVGVGPGDGDGGVGVGVALGTLIAAVPTTSPAAAVIVAELVPVHVTFV